jgi:hypothetical protein
MDFPTLFGPLLILFGPLLILFGPLLIIALVVSLVTGRRRPERRKVKMPKLDHATRQEHGVWGWAKVLTSKPVGSPGIGGLQRIALELEVHLPGNPAYTASTVWLVEQELAGYVETGKEVSVKVDPAALKYVYPQGSWAKYVE